MKQKNYKWVVFVLGIIILGGVFYVATKDITPISRHVETSVPINYNK